MVVTVPAELTILTAEALTAALRLTDVRPLCMLFQVPPYSAESRTS